MPTIKKKKKLMVSTRSADQMGQAIGRFRAQANLTQAELAQAAGLRQATLSKVENRAGATELNTIYALCAVLELEIVLQPREMTMGQFKPEELF